MTLENPFSLISFLYGTSFHYMMYGVIEVRKTPQPSGPALEPMGVPHLTPTLHTCPHTKGTVREPVLSDLGWCLWLMSGDE